MAEFKEVMKQFKRMCDGQKWCDNCQIIDNRGRFSCSRWLTENPTKAEEIIMTWAKKNPIKTNGMKFYEVFGINLDSIEVICRDGEGKVSHHQDVSAWLSKEYKQGQE